MRFTVILASLWLVVSSAFGQTTNFVTATNSPGTKMIVPVKTSALWRRILPTETPFEALYDLGITNDPTGLLYTTNGTGGTNAPGRYVADITSADHTVRVLKITTNLNGGMTVDLGADIAGIISTSGTNGYDATAIRDGYFFTLANGSTLATNYFWMDFGRTNAFGQHLIYASAIATNDIVILGPTNCATWGLLSFNLLASGADRKVYFPPVIFGLNTNGLSFTNGWAFTTVSNGYLWRSTTQSNSVLETIWRVN